MSEQPTSAITPQPQPAAGPEREPSTVQAPKPGRVAAVPVGVLLALAFVALGIVGWQWYDTRNQVSALEQELARRLAEGDARNKEALAAAQEVRKRTHELDVQVATLEGGLAESQNQQVALEALYQQLSRSSDQWALAEI